MKVRVKELQERYKAAQEQECKAKRREAINEAARPVFAFAAETEAERRRMYGEQAINTARRMIYDSVPPCGDVHGNRHDERLRASRLLGGYVAGELLFLSEVRAALEDFVRANTDDFAYAMKDVEDGLNNGMASPITFEQLERERETYVSRHTATEPAIKPQTPEERQSKKDAFRKMVRERAAQEDEYTPTRRRATSADFAALSIITAELGFSDKSRVGLQALIGLSEGKSTFEWEFKSLYPYLRKYDSELYDLLKLMDKAMPKERECNHSKCKTNRCEKTLRQAQSKINGIVRGYLDKIDSDQSRCKIRLAKTNRGT